MGRLRRCLARGELGSLRELRLLESEFLQVTHTGDPAGPVTIAIAASSPHLPVPDLLLLARPLPPSAHEDHEELQLLGLLPLSCVHLSLWNRHRHQLRVHLVTGRTFYLQLLAPSPWSLQLLFTRWLRLLFLLRGTHGCPPGPAAPWVQVGGQSPPVKAEGDGGAPVVL